jgi:hypothetical protein
VSGTTKWIRLVPAFCDEGHVFFSAIAATVGEAWDGPNDSVAIGDRPGRLARAPETPHSSSIITGPAHEADEGGILEGLHLYEPPSTRPDARSRENGSRE